MTVAVSLTFRISPVIQVGNQHLCLRCEKQISQPPVMPAAAPVKL